MNGDELIEECVLRFLILPALGTHAHTSLWGAGGFDHGRQHSASICQLPCSYTINHFINRFIYRWWKRLWCICLILYISGTYFNDNLASNWKSAWGLCWSPSDLTRLSNIKIIIIIISRIIIVQSFLLSTYISYLP